MAPLVLGPFLLLRLPKFCHPLTSSEYSCLTLKSVCSTRYHLLDDQYFYPKSQHSQPLLIATPCARGVGLPHHLRTLVHRRYLAWMVQSLKSNNMTAVDFSHESFCDYLGPPCHPNLATPPILASTSSTHVFVGSLSEQMHSSVRLGG